MREREGGGGRREGKRERMTEGRKRRGDRKEKGEGKKEGGAVVEGKMRRGTREK